jgi:hypothetical protein
MTRAQQMLAMYLAGGTLESIAVAQEPKITRERVRQILTRTKEYHFERSRRVGDKQSYKCRWKECQNVIWLMPSVAKGRPNPYCSRECLRKGRFGNGDATARHLAMTEKRCSREGVIKPISEFYAETKNGKFKNWNAHCKKCQNKTVMAWRERNLERSKEAMRVWQKKNRARLSAKWRERYYKDVEASRKKGRDYYHRNRERSRELRRESYRRRALLLGPL